MYGGYWLRLYRTTRDLGCVWGCSFRGAFVGVFCYDPGHTQSADFEARSGNWPVAHATRPQWAGHWAIRCQGTPIRPLDWSEPAQSVLGALPHTPSLHERRQPGAVSRAQSGVLWAPVWHQTGGAWPQGTPRAGGLRRGSGGAGLCLNRPNIDPRAAIFSRPARGFQIPLVSFGPMWGCP